MPQHYLNMPKKQKKLLVKEAALIEQPTNPEIKSLELPKDFIFDSFSKKNPTCILANGDKKGFSELKAGDSVFIKTGNEKFKVGKITGVRWDTETDNWTYMVEVNGLHSLKSAKDFRYN